LNSGVQIRSRIAAEEKFFVFTGRDGKPRTGKVPPDRVYGYQVEIASAERGSSGGIYDEARRGFFLADVRDDPAASKALKNNQWNRYRIECNGSSIKTSVNGIPCADLRDSMDAKGTIGLQVHGIGKNFQPYQVRWRNIRIKELNVGGKKELKVAVITGGHGFEREPFFKMFDQMDGIHYTETPQKDHSELFEDIRGWDYDVMVFYNMTQNISPKRRKNFLKLLDKGIGVVALHHTMGAYQEWPEFKKIIGTKMNDFTIHDETYKNCWFDDENQVLLTTDHPTSDKTIGWVREHGNAKVCTIQLGHDSKAYGNNNYPRLVRRAILWTAGKL
jgi:type 1 glutamine amidotransferase